MAANGIRIFGVDPLEENLLHVSLTLCSVWLTFQKYTSAGYFGMKGSVPVCFEICTPEPRGKGEKREEVQI